ncbi:nucleoside/nucleotide kinase family protein [Blastococcus xanthinilyticus]|uniref:ArgK protein n=1 Tax=Blastococcus xanthinilyticus TaxID=1564164 RepID=A0A5S5D583_9ACTN|nr:nucleoside/nucleotide kinase family protein [Blastococcus xanthinilyticus]TYP90458.1 ArgK protein [Blastococcus xanthinilyticus]
MHEQTLPDAGSPPVVRATPQQLVERAAALARPGTRRLLGITGAPGAGKSTLCAALLDALGDRAALAAMDGFHYANAELARLGRADRKGAPDTFDVDGYVALLDRLRTPPAVPVYAPVFDRALEEPIGSAVPVWPDTPLVLTEGNYLLLDEHGWSAVRTRLDEVWYLDLAPAVRERRLLRRRRSYGHEPEAAEAWVRSVDGRNARTVETSRPRADLVVHLDVPETTGDDLPG